jgi:hypothetical protein
LVTFDPWIIKPSSRGIGLQLQQIAHDVQLKRRNMHAWLPNRGWERSDGVAEHTAEADFVWIKS